VISHTGRKVSHPRKTGAVLASKGDERSSIGLISRQYAGEEKLVQCQEERQIDATSGNVRRVMNVVIFFNR